MGQITPEYIAGFFDGEGCIHAHKTLKHLNVFLTQMNPSILYMVQAIYGGNVGQNKRTKAYAWRCSGNTREKFLRDIEPFVIIKKKQVELALEWECAKEQSMVRNLNIKTIEYKKGLQTRKERRIEKERIRIALIDDKTKYYGHLRGNYSVSN